MKKAIFATITVLLALVIVTCDAFPPAPESNNNIVGYTDDGRPLIELSIGINRSGRALTLDLAKGGVDYYEVAFQDPTNPSKVYRTSWDYTRTGRISIPPGDYGNNVAIATAPVIKAILFAGRYDDKTLLAVGALSSIGSTAVSGNNAVITPSTTQVTFTLKELENDVNDDPATSTFQITGPIATAITNDGGANWIYVPTSSVNYSTGNISSSIPHVNLNSKEYPIFMIPHDYTNHLTDDYDGTTGDVFATDGKITATYAISVPYSWGVIITEAKTLSKGYFYGADKGVVLDVDFANVTIVSGTDFSVFQAVETKTPVVAPNATSNPGGFFELEIDTDGVDPGLSRLSLEIAVKALKNDTTNDSAALTWYIRGGMSNNLLDEGATENSLGGAVLLGVGPVDAFGIEIVVTGP